METPMKTPVKLSFTPRARRNIDECLDFIGRFPRGKPADRRQDLISGITLVHEAPERNPVEIRRKTSGIELRRQYTRQFAIVYSWFRPAANCPGGEVSIRAVRHRRVKNVFRGVRETDEMPSSAWLETSAHRTV
jgi:hypothetical protein